MASPIQNSEGVEGGIGHLNRPPQISAKQTQRSATALKLAACPYAAQSAQKNSLT